MEVPPSTRAGKNSADMRLVIDAFFAIRDQLVSLKRTSSRSAGSDGRDSGEGSPLAARPHNPASRRGNKTGRSRGVGGQVRSDFKSSCPTASMMADNRLICLLPPSPRPRTPPRAARAA